MPNGRLFQTIFGGRFTWLTPSNGGQAQTSPQAPRPIPPEPSMECCICTTKLCAPLEVLPCYHIYHRKCIRSWFRVRYTCPLCQKTIKGHARESYERRLARSDLLYEYLGPDSDDEDSQNWLDLSNYRQYFEVANEFATELCSSDAFVALISAFFFGAFMAMIWRGVSALGGLLSTVAIMAAVMVLFRDRVGPTPGMGTNGRGAPNPHLRHVNHADLLD